jgi:hypothetical protein
LESVDGLTASSLVRSEAIATASVAAAELMIISRFSQRMYRRSDPLAQRPLATIDNRHDPAVKGRADVERVTVE